MLFNRSAAEREISINWSDLGYPGHLHAAVRDLWQHKDLGTFEKEFSARVELHGVVMITVKP